jgi:uncharacterized protein DUF4357
LRTSASCGGGIPRPHEHETEPHISQVTTDELLVPAGGHLRFTRAHLFDSPSTAAGVLLGRSVNGRIEWKNPSGQTLKEIQEAALQQPSSPTSADL